VHGRAHGDFGEGGAETPDWRMGDAREEPGYVESDAGTGDAASELVTAEIVEEEQAGEGVPGVEEAETEASAASATPTSAVTEVSAATLIGLNIGGCKFTTTAGTINKENWLVSAIVSGKEKCTRDDEGNFFLDRDSTHFEKFLNCLRASEEEPYQLDVPSFGSAAFRELYAESGYYRFEPFLKQLEEVALREVDSETSRRLENLEKERSEVMKRLSEKTKRQAREIEQLRIELERIKYELNKTQIIDKHKRTWLFKPNGPELSFNLLIVGNSGAGKSSSLNSLLNYSACRVSGAQAQGTRGSELRDGVLDESLISYIDTQGLGADTSITDVELLEQIMLATGAVQKMGVINNVLIAFDLSARATPAAMANQITLTNLFQELQRTCFACFTKWNTNSVMSEWNHPLKNWMRRWRKANSVEEITEDPPSFSELYAAYTDYLKNSLSMDVEDTAFGKISTHLAFFESRLIWMYNLDPVEREDLSEDCLPAYKLKLYTHYRKQAIDVLHKGKTYVETAHMSFLQHDKATLKGIARSLIKARDSELKLLELSSSDPQKRQRMAKIFSSMSASVVDNMKRQNFQKSDYCQQVAGVAGIVKKTTKVGCAVS